MELHLHRTYYPTGTNGLLLLNGEKVCSTIELPWKNNAPQVSCIPEGRYALQKRYSRKFCWHLQVMDVPDRELILIHPANNALIELQGCIAPVAILTAPGTGLQSKTALFKLTGLAFAALRQQESIFLTIKTGQI